MERSFRSLLLIPCLHPRSNTGEHGVERRSIVDLATQYDRVNVAGVQQARIGAGHDAHPGGTRPRLP